MTYSKSKAAGKHYNGFVIPANDVGEYLTYDYIKSNAGVCDFGMSLIREIYGDKPAKIITRAMVGKHLSPYFLAFYLRHIDPIAFTVVKKAFRMGRGASSKEQDIYDIIGACRQGLIYTTNRTAMYQAIEKLCNDELERMKNEH